jgi:hypothetical protein
VALVDAHEEAGLRLRRRHGRTFPAQTSSNSPVSDVERRGEGRRWRGFWIRGGGGAWGEGGLPLPGRSEAAASREKP